MTEAEHEAMLDAEVVGCVRDAAKDVTGGNCAFADDDVAVLAHLAHRAVRAGLTDKLSPHIQKRIASKSAQGMAPEGRGREGGPGSSELPSPVAASDAPKGVS